MNKEPKQLDLFIPEVEDEPPSTNRGVIVSIHYLSLTFFGGIKEPISHFLKEFMNYDIDDEMEWSEYFFNTKYSGRGYQAIFKGPDNVTLYGFPYEGKHCHLEMKGQFLELYGTKQVINYLKVLIESEIDWRCTRIDIAFDHVPFMPQDCYDAWKRGDIVCKCNKKSWDWRQNSEGNTLYIGSRMSDRYIRIYDKRMFTRLELVFKKEWAENIAQIVTKIEHKLWIKQTVGYLLDYITFIDKSDKMNKKIIMLRWWADFIRDSENIKLNIKKRDINVDLRNRYQNFLMRLLPTLYIMRHGLNLDMNKIIDEHALELKSKHLNALKILQK